MGVLDDMTKGITERKAAAAGPKLTPVGLEASGTKPSLAIPTDLPGRFMAGEDLGIAAAQLRIHAATLIATADALDALIVEESRRSETEDPKKVAAAAKVAAEKVGDEKAAARDAAKFAEEFAAKQAEAQAKVFAAADAPSEEPAAASGWTCPDHGDTVKQLTSRKGRDYTACTTAGCTQFER